MKNKAKRTKYVIFKNKAKVALVLGGGGARGFAHIGVIKAFEEHGIEFDMVVGTSAGALVGGMYSAGLTSKQILENTKNFKLKDIRTSTIPFMPNKSDAMEEVYNKIIGGPKNFEDLKVPFCAVAVDVKSGNEIHLTKGDVAKSVVASCAVPGIFFPVEIDDYKLFDGGLLNNIPTSVAKKLGADIVVTVDINSARGGGTDSKKYLDMVFSSISIMMKNSSIKGYLYADVLIKPDMRKFSAAKLTGRDEMVELGYKTTIKQIDEIKKLMGIKIKSPTMRERWASRKKKITVENDGSLQLEFEETAKDFLEDEQKETTNNKLLDVIKADDNGASSNITLSNKTKELKKESKVNKKSLPLKQNKNSKMKDESSKKEDKKQGKVVIVKNTNKTAKEDKKQSQNKKGKTIIVATKKEVPMQKTEQSAESTDSKTTAKPKVTPTKLKPASAKTAKPKTKNKPVVIVKNKKTSKK